MLSKQLAGDVGRPDRDEDDEDLDLPAFDVGDDDAEGEAGTDKFEDDLPALRDDGGDPFDDANAADLDIGVHIDDDDARDTSADASGDAVDVGSLDEDFAQFDNDASALDEERGTDGFVEDDELGAFDGEASAADDGGFEGTGEDAANDIDESALPELDESEHDHADETLGDVLLEEAARAQLPSWAASRFVPLEGAGASVPCASVSVVGGRVFAAGDVVLTVDEGAHAARTVGLEAPCLAIAATEEMAAIATVRGGLLVSRDGCASAASVAGFRSSKGPLGLACTPGRVWLLHDGALWSMAGGDNALVRVRESGVRAIAATNGSLLALSSRSDGVFVERFRGDDEAWQSTALPLDVAKFVTAEHRPMLVATAEGKASCYRVAARALRIERRSTFVRADRSARSIRSLFCGRRRSGGLDGRHDVSRRYAGALDTRHGRG
ncbi:MAG: hypothetical protein IPM54_44445 [Polyangiaceae bacterium]|nr:hypothetical protein [Polyangiaceae bacterium]